MSRPHIAAIAVRRSHGAATVLDGVTMTVSTGERVGLIGRNGAGKSTLLRLLAGIEPPDDGTVTRSPSSLAVAYVAQERDGLPGETVRGSLARRAGLAGAEAHMDALAARLGGEPQLAGAYSEALERFLALGGGDFDARAAAACAEAGLAPDLLDRPLRALSGGQAARAALAAILLTRVDVLLLDEPANDLDVDGIELLERHLRSTPAGVVLVSHDRELLDATMTSIVELDEFSRRTTAYAGGFSDYERAREQARRRAAEEHGRYAAERQRLLETARQKRDWATRGAARARRQPADRDRFLRGARVQGAESAAAGAAAIERRLARLAVVEKPREPWDLRLPLAARRRSGEVVATLEGVLVERPRFRLGPIDLDLRWRDRLLLGGPNGSGKTTLLAALAGHVQLDGGRRRIGRGVSVGLLDQRRSVLPAGAQLLASFCALTRQTPEEARTLLAKVGLGAEHVLRPVVSLSPGERTRASVAALVARGSNCLLLDEPTNHLDLAAIEPLEEALRGYDGTLVVVSHDRRFVSALALEGRVELRDGRMLDP